jgi:GntR family uxuAB operon transcriptional repressor
VDTAAAAWAAVGPMGSPAIAAELRRTILDGEYIDGERLPPERQLADLFKASRTTIRRALKRLEDIGLVVRRIGSGTFVDHRPRAAEWDIAEVIGPLELIEARLVVEPQMARLAGLNGSGRDLDYLGEALAAVEAVGEDPEVFTRLDEEFHRRIALCTQNPLMVSIYNRINEVRGHAQWVAMRDTILTPARIAEYNAQHRAVYEALSRRDVALTASIIEEHLEKARSDLLGAGHH